MVAQNLLLLHVPVSPVWISLCVPAILHQWLRLSLVQPGVDVPNQKEQSMSYNKQETPNTKGKKKVRRRRTTTTHHHHHHHLHITFCPYSNHRDHRELRLKTLQPNMAFEPWMTSSVAWSFCPSSAWHGVAGSYVISNWIQWHPHRDQAIASPPTGRISKWICFNGFLHGFVAGIFHGCFLYQFV